MLHKDKLNPVEYNSSAEAPDFNTLTYITPSAIFSPNYAPGPYI